MLTMGVVMMSMIQYDRCEDGDSDGNAAWLGGQVNLVRLFRIPESLRLN